MSLPALEHLRADYTEVWTSGPVVPLVRFADRSLSIEASGLDLLELPDHDPNPHVLQSLRTFHSIVSWYGSTRPEFRARVAELALPFHFFPALPWGGGEHAMDFYWRQAQTLNSSPIRGRAPTLDCPRTEEGFAVIHPFSGSRRKNWPLDRFQELAQRLEGYCPVFWCASPEDRLEGAVQIENLYELACWLAKARVFIGNDSGISHLAASVRTPVVALFGPTDPTVWAPRGGPVAVLRAGPAMTDISTEAVLEAVCKLVFGH